MLTLKTEPYFTVLNQDLNNLASCLIIDKTGLGGLGGLCKMADISVVASSLGTLMLSLIVLWIAAKWRPSCFNCFVGLRIAAASLASQAVFAFN